MLDAVILILHEVTFMPIDNDYFDRMGGAWWDEKEFLHTIRAILNPGRLEYFRGALNNTHIDPKDRHTLDIGCGGGLLAEEFAKMGCKVAGIDPSRRSIDTAKAHARQTGLKIDYVVAPAENIPFVDKSFDIIYCCDVLEHVNDLKKVIAETARVLRDGGIYLYDTINRTWRSKLVYIKLLQEWKWSRLLPPDLHDWKIFIKPRELHEIMARHGIKNKGLAGLAQNNIGDQLKLIANLRRLNRGETTYTEVGRRINLSISKNIALTYIGYGIKY